MTEEIKKVVEDFTKESYKPYALEFFEDDPDHKFFERFIEEFPTRNDFVEVLRDNYDYEEDLFDDEDDMMSDEEAEKQGLKTRQEVEDDYYWSPELEVEVIQDSVGSYCGTGLWVDFYNELVKNNW